MNDKKYDVVALGELLIDFCEGENMVFEANPGGAPCNVLSMLTKLGKKCAFIGKVGNDMFGRMLKDALCEVGIDDIGLCFDEEVNTTLAFVHNKEDGEREFSFYRSPGADMMLSINDVDLDMISSCRIFHFGTLSSTADICRRATRYAIDVAKKSGCIISFDPNLREKLWDNSDKAKEEILFGLSVCNVVKIADNELEFLYDTDYDYAMRDILNKNENIKMAFLTLGKDGAIAYTRKNSVKVGGFTVNSVDATGAGDTFMGCILSYIAEHGVDGLDNERVKKLVTFANAAAALVTTKKGALKSMPEETEIKGLIVRNNEKSNH